MVRIALDEKPPPLVYKQPGAGELRLYVFAIDANDLHNQGYSMGLKVLTWNISYGYGLGSEGDARYQPKSRAHFESSLNAIASVIEQLDVDIALLQEVDFSSRRSHHVNQLDWLSRRTRMLYRSQITTWDRAYVPYPGLNPLRHFGAVCSGGGILSKTRILPLQFDLLAKPRENHPLYNYFYLSRFLQLVEVEGLRICNLHLEAFSESNRELHLIRLHDRLLDYQIDLAGGDFNGPALLNERTRLTWAEAVTPRPTYPSQMPDRTLDHFILKKNRIRPVSIRTLDTGTVSDHLPVLLEFESVSS
ncbi:hypothetical protein EB061_01430 [bacterium]|nr:hypothetical protein [bacterium]